MGRRLEKSPGCQVPPGLVREKSVRKNKLVRSGPTLEGRGRAFQSATVTTAKANTLSMAPLRGSRHRELSNERSSENPHQANMRQRPVYRCRMLSSHNSIGISCFAQMSTTSQRDHLCWHQCSTERGKCP